MPTAHISINALLDRGESVDALAVEVEGILASEAEGYHLLHYPKAHRHPDELRDGMLHQSSLWIGFGSGSVQPNPSTLAHWVGRRVRVHGIVQAKRGEASREFHHHGGFGPYGLWPMQIEPYSIQRVTSEQRKDNI